MCLVRFGFGRNKLVQLLTRCRNSGSRTVQSLIIITIVIIIIINTVNKTYC